MSLEVPDVAPELSEGVAAENTRPWGRPLGRVRRLTARFSDGRGVLASSGAAALVRGLGLFTNLLAMPIALHTLGTGRFGVFLMLFGIVNWLVLGTFGVQSAVGKAIASGEVEGEGVRDLLGAALVFAAAAALALVVPVAIGFFVWLNTAARGLPVSRAELMSTGLWMIGLIAVQGVLQVFEGVQMGRLKLYLANLMKLGGALFTLVALVALPRVWPSMAVFVVAVNGGVVLSAALNGALVLRRITPRFRHLRRDLVGLRRLALSGAAFQVIGLSALGQSHVLVLMLASLLGPAQAVDFGLFIRLLLIFVTVLSMFTAPLWPALMNAGSTGDLGWSRRAIERSGLLVVGAGLLAFLGLALFGGAVLKLWTGRVLSEGPWFQVLFGLYFFQVAWSHYWATILIGLKREWLVARLFVVEIAVVLFASLLLTQRFGEVAMLVCMNVGFLLASNAWMPLLARREMNRVLSPATA